MIPEYNKIDLNKDDLGVVKAKIAALKEALKTGTISEAEYSEEQTRVLKEYEALKPKLGYAFTW